MPGRSGQPWPMTVRAIQAGGTFVQAAVDDAPVTKVAPSAASAAVVPFWPRRTVHVVETTVVTVTIS